MGSKRWHGSKTVRPHNYSRIFARFRITHELLWKMITERLKIKKDNLILVTGDTGTGKSTCIGNLCFKKAAREPNFIANDGSMMFEDEKSFVIDPDELSAKMIHGEGDVLWVDESRDALSRRNWASKINKTIISRKNKNRKLLKVIFLLLPYEKEVDTEMSKHVNLWIWVKRRGICEVYCRRSGVKGGSGLNITEILKREERYLKENPEKSTCPPYVHPEFVGYFTFGPFTSNLEKRYLHLVDVKKATGELSDEEKEKYGIEVKKKPKEIIQHSIKSVKDGKIKSKKELWQSLSKIDLDDEKKLKKLNFYLKLEGWGNFNTLFKEEKTPKGKRKVW